MKNKLLKISFIFLLCVILMPSIYAATLNISGATSGSPNGKVTITISGDFTGRVNLSASNGTLSSSKVWIENNSQTVTVTLGSSGTTSITATPSNVSDQEGNIISLGAKSKSISITQPSNNNTNTNTNTNTKPNTNTNKNNTNTTTNKNNNSNKNTTTKSSNANLKNMILSVEGLSPAFAKNITSYSVNVGENVDTIKVNATVEHSRASYSVSGNTNLKAGENVINVKVTAEDGTVKTYKINVLKSDDPVKSDATLSSVIIEDVDLGQAFDPNVTEYNAGDITVKSNKLNIYAYPTNDNAKVEILGNENLKVGENKITIKVTSENGKVTKEYSISFNKLYSEESSSNVDIYGDTSISTSDKKSFWDKIKDWYELNLKEKMTVIVLYVFVWVEFIQVVYLYRKLKKYEDLDKITVGKRIVREKGEIKKVEDKQEKIEKPRRIKQNPVFPEDETEKKE